MRTLYQAGKLDNVLAEMDNLKISCLGLCEVRWTGAGDFIKNERRIFYSGGSKHQHGVGLILNRSFSSSVLSFMPKNERMMLIKIRASPFNVNILVTYAPTSEEEEDIINSYYRDLDALYSSCKSNEITILLGDLNAKVGAGRDGNIVGPHGLGERNERGDRFVDWCKMHNQVIMNTWFKQHPRRLYTWTSPGDRARNQIDFITINSRFRNAIKSCRTFPGADVDSDHNPVIANLRLSLKRVEHQKRPPKFAVSQLEQLEVRDNFKEHVIKSLPEFPPDNVTDHWQVLTTAIKEAAEANIPKQDQRRNKAQWFTSELEHLLVQRRISKPNHQKYQELNRLYKRRCQETKEAWLEEKCAEVERLHLNGKALFRKIKEIAGRPTPPASKCIKAADGQILHDIKEVSARWEEYIQDLFHDDQEMDEIDLDSTKTGPPILKSEVKWAIGKMKSGKSCGPDEIYTEMIKALEDEGIEAIWRLINKIYETGIFPKDMLKSVFVLLPKIPGTLDCSSHRTISLMSHILKVLLKIVLERIRRKIIPEIPDTQFGFMKDRGTRNAIFTLRMLSERAVQHQQDLFFCFIDYQKAFDKVRHCELLKILTGIQIDDKDMGIIRSVYRDQLAAVRLFHGLTDWFPIKRGVRQGCVMSPDLFNLYSEVILRKLEEREEGILVNGVNINNLRYADDTVLIASSKEDLQNLFDVVVKESEALGLHINAKKTKCMVVSKSDTPPTCHLIHGQIPIEQVSNFNYLGTMVTSDSRCKKEIRRRIGMSKEAYVRMKNIFNDRKLDIKLKIRLLKTFVWSVLLYGCECWTMTVENRRNLEAAEMWFLRRMFRISYVDRITNEEVLNRAEQKRTLIHTIEQRQLSFLGHIIRKGALEDLSLTGKINGKRARGGQRRTFLQNFKTSTRNVRDTWDKARDRTAWKEIIHGVRLLPNR